GSFLGPAESAQRSAGQDTLLQRRVGVGGLRHVGSKCAWSQGVDANTVWCKLNRRHVGELHETCLGYAVGQGARRSEYGRNGSDIDDGSVSACHHLWGDGLNPEQGGFDVDGHDAVELILPDAQQGSTAEDARIVDENVNAAEIFRGGG